MKTSQQGIELIKRHEELRLRAYDDFRPNMTLLRGDTVYGTVTIGYGHTRTARPGMVISAGEAERLLRDDLGEAEGAVQRNTEGMELSQHAFDALVSFVFNVGAGNFRTSTLLRKMKERRPADEVAAEFERWVFSKGRRLAGLEKRRRDEAALFLGLK